MTMARRLQLRLNQTLTWQSFSGYSAGYGVPSFSTSQTTYRTREYGKQHLVVDASGREVMSKGLLYVGPSTTGGLPAITAQDRVIGPGSTRPVKMLAVDTLRDRTDTHHQVIHLG